MLKEDSIMNEQIRRAIRQRARHARSNNDLVSAIFDSFRSSQVDLRRVSLEDMKRAVVIAACAAKSVGVGSLPALRA